MITLYHCATAESAEAILRDGFKDPIATYEIGYGGPLGVWLSDVPLDAGDLGYLGPTLLRVTLNQSEEAINRDEWKAESMLVPCEGWVSDQKGYREWLIPVELITTSSAIEILDEEAEVAIETDIWMKKGARTK